MSELQAVLFDMDGTLCDTEPAWMATEREMAARNGAEWTREDGLALVGNNLIDSGRYMKARMGLAQSPEAIVDELLVGVGAWIRTHGVDWCPGAIDLVEACNDAGLPTALVTMSYRRFAESVVEAMPAGRFDALVTGDEVRRGKPAPDAYLDAAAALGVEAAACVAIEDSPTGSAAAVAAGCRVIVVPNHVEVPTSEGVLVWSTLRDVTVEDLRAACQRG